MELIINEPTCSVHGRSDCGCLVDNSNQHRDALGRFASAPSGSPPATDPTGARGPYAISGLKVESDTGELGAKLRKVIDKGRQTVKQVPISSLVVTQGVVRRLSVEHMIKNPRQQQDYELPIVVKTGGKSYLWDGHHRITAAKFSGEKKVRVRVYS